MFLPSQQRSDGARYVGARAVLFLAGAAVFLLGATLDSRPLVWLAIAIFLAALVLRLLAHRRTDAETHADDP